MSTPPAHRLSTFPVLLGLFGLLFAGTAAALLFLPGPRSPLPALGVAGLGVVGVLGFRQVLARARDTELALEEGERYIEAVADLSQDIHAIIEARRRTFLYLNPAVANLLGYPAEEFTRGGLAFFASLVHPEDLPSVKAQFEELLALPAAGQEPGAGERMLEQTFRIQDRRGVHRWFKSRMTVFMRNAAGQTMELLAVIRDVTEESSHEAALMEARKSESLRALARGTLHDLNNTLMGLQGHAELAMAGPDDARALRDSLDRVQSAVARASALCRQMVDFTGDGRIQIVRRQLNDAVRESLPALESMIPPNGRLEVDLEEDLPEVAADLGQVRYALLNLVFNAAEAIRIPGGEITVRTRVKHLTQAAAPGLEGPHVCLEVRDSGPGKPPEVVERIFDPGFAGRWPGQGLGLSTVQGIMREHRGGVHTVSAPGCGDTTQVFFPLAGDAPAMAAPEPGPAAGFPPGAILLVDDEPEVRSVLRLGLEQAGYQVVEAGDGVEGLSAFVRHRPSIALALVDLTMPRLGGEGLFQEIHQLAPDLPVVLMSGYTEQDATATLADRGLAGFLAKPCGIRETLMVVEAALGAPSKS
jgi:PAS domain S-box-containing protein